jgi:hypothetical protein
MRLYTRTGATALTDPKTGITYKADEQGGFDFPDEFSDEQQGFATRGRPMWENDIQRQRRVMAEEMERRKDPAAMLEVMEQLLQAAKSAPAAPPAPEAAAEASSPAAKQARKRAAAKPAAE